MISWVSGEAYNPGPKRLKAHVGDVRYRFHNVHGLTERAFRQHYLGRARATCDVLALVETNCVSDEQAAVWARDWHGSSGTFWTPCPPELVPSTGGSARGVAILFSSNLGDVQASVLWKDPRGRGLAIKALIRNIPTIIVAFHADNKARPDKHWSADRAQAESYASLKANVPYHADHEYILLLDANNVPNPDLDEQRVDGGPPVHSHVLGLAAMRECLAHFGGLRDAFRARCKYKREYTRNHNGRVGEVTVRRRLDRAYVGMNTLRRGAPPLLTDVTHIRPSDLDMAALRMNGSQRQYSDHAAVQITMRYTNTPKPTSRWHFPAHLLKSPETVARLRGDVVRADASTSSACEALGKLLETSYTWTNAKVTRATIDHRQRRQKLIKERAQCRALLGDEFGARASIEDIPDPAERARARLTAEARQREVEDQLEEIVAAEQRRWCENRGYENHLHGETCWRGFFEDTRVSRTYSHIEQVQTHAGRTFTSTGEILKETRRHFCGDGQIFNLHRQHTASTSTNRQRLYDALVTDGKGIRATDRDQLSLDTMFTPERVQEAINELNAHTAPGHDGWTAEYVKVVGMELKEENERGELELMPSSLAKLLSRVFHECARDHDLMDCMKESVVSLIYKNKGVRHNLKYYRPIAVSSVFYRVMAKTMVIALRPLLSQIVSTCQKAFQPDQHISELTRFVQDLIDYCDAEDVSGILLFCDQDNAYPRVEWDFMFGAMETMGVHDDFISMVRTMYQSARLRFKVNGIVDTETTAVSNSVAQGCPLSPLLYLMCIQCFISLIHVDSQRADGIKGIEIPGELGDTTQPTMATVCAFADDLMISLRDADQLDRFKELLFIYEDGSGAVNSWEKTCALRVGSLRDDEYLPEGWEDGVNIDCSSALIRYLGIFLGADEAVAKQWEEKTTKRVRERLNLWRERGVPMTRAGRNVVIRNSVLALAWYLCEHQPLPNLESMMNAWREDVWDFIARGAIAAANGTRRGHTNVKHTTLVQDYTEHGTRAVDVELFTRSLHIRKVRSMVEPSQGHTLHLPYFWINKHYGHLRQGKRLLMSSCDFLKLTHADTPLRWRAVLKPFGAMRGFRPRPAEETTPGTRSRDPRTPRDLPREGWSLGEVLMEPLHYNPHITGEWGGPLSDTPEHEIDDRAARPACHLIRPSPHRLVAADAYYDRTKRFAAAGATHVLHLLSGWGAHEDLRLMTGAQFANLQRTRLPARAPLHVTVAEFDALIQHLPFSWKTVIQDAIAAKRAHPIWTLQDVVAHTPLPPGAWVQTADGRVGNLVSTPTGTCVTTWYTPNPSGRLTEGNAHNTPQSQLGAHAQVHVWAALNLAHSQLERKWRDRHEEKKPPPVTWCGGPVVDWPFFTAPTSACRGAVNLGEWEWQMHKTDRTRPPVAVASADVHHIYWQQLSYLFTPMRTFDLNAVPHNDGREHTTWVDLLSNNGTPCLGEGEYEVDRVTAARQNDDGGDDNGDDGGEELCVRWRGYGAAFDTWIPRADLELTAAAAVRRFDAHGPDDVDDDPPAADVCTSCEEQKTRRAIFDGFRAAGMNKVTEDYMYSVLADAFPIGNGRCQKKGVRHMQCDACMARDGVHTQETTRHAHLECPHTEVVLVAMHLATHAATATNQVELTRVRNLPTSDLALEAKRALVTGVRIGDVANGSNTGGKPYTILIGETHRALAERRQRNALCENMVKIDSDPATLYTLVRTRMANHVRWSLRAAEAESSKYRISYPGWEQKDNGPLHDWETEWVKSGWVQDGKLNMPPTIHDIPGMAGRLGTGRVHLRLTVTAGGAVTPDLTTSGVRAARSTQHEHFDLLTPDAMVVYMDGSGGNQRAATPRAGWGFVCVTSGDGRDDLHATRVDEGFGPVVTDTAAPAFRGALKHTNNTGELTACIEALTWLLEDGATRPVQILLRPDSEYVMGLVTGRTSATNNRALVNTARALYTRLQRQRSGAVGWSHVRAHTGHKWNEYVDGLADKGAACDMWASGGGGSAWHATRLDGPLQTHTGPLHAHEYAATLIASRTGDTCDVFERAELIGRPRDPGRYVAPGVSPADISMIPAMEVTEVMRVERAMHAFGILNLYPRTMRDEEVNRARDDTLTWLARERTTTETHRWKRVCARVRHAHSTLATAAARATELTRIGLIHRPTTRTVRCPIDANALRTFLTSPLARRRPHGDYGRVDPSSRTYGEQTRDFLSHAQYVGTDTDTGIVDITYREAARGAAMREAGHIHMSREYAKGPDPFRLPKMLRKIALAKFGFDFDDAAAYPRAGSHLIDEGRDLLRRFLAVTIDAVGEEINHREQVLAAIGERFFPWVPEADERRDRAKQLINALEMDGSFESWCDGWGVSPHLLGGLIVSLPDGPFDVHHFITMQPARTRWMISRRPRALAFTQQMCANDPTAHPDRTLKSYILQEREAVSRHAKLAWAERTGCRWISLQHDGVVITLRPGMTTAWACEEMRRVCSSALGYDQPVEKKDMNNNITPDTCDPDTWIDARLPVAATHWGTHVERALTLTLPTLLDGETRALASFPLLIASPTARPAPHVCTITRHLPAITRADTSEIRATCWDILMDARRGFHVDTDTSHGNADHGGRGGDDDDADDADADDGPADTHGPAGESGPADSDDGDHADHPDSPPPPPHVADADPHAGNTRAPPTMQGEASSHGNHAPAATTRLPSPSCSQLETTCDPHASAPPPTASSTSPRLAAMGNTTHSQALHDHMPTHDTFHRTPSIASPATTSMHAHDTPNDAPHAAPHVAHDVQARTQAWEHDMRAPLHAPPPLRTSHATATTAQHSSWPHSLGSGLAAARQAVRETWQHVQAVVRMRSSTSSTSTTRGGTAAHAETASGSDDRRASSTPAFPQTSRQTSGSRTFRSAFFSNPRQPTVRHKTFHPRAFWEFIASSTRPPD